MYFLEILKGIFFGILEGITEWLPISSTGHLILLNEFMKLNVGGDLGPTFAEEFWQMFEVVIQLGAILAVIVLFFHKLNPFATSKTPVEKKETWQMWFKILVASVPAALFGIGLDMVLEALTQKDMEGWLYNAWVVSAMLILYGIAFILVEKLHKGREPRITEIHGISYKTAFLIGAFQALSVIPGTSRSGSTILGAIFLGLSRPAGAEFSFFMAIPAMLGAGLLKSVGFLKYTQEAQITVPLLAWIVLAVACLVAFLVSLAVIRFLMDFVRKHSFAPFGYYRIALGLAVLLFFFIRSLVAA